MVGLVKVAIRNREQLATLRVRDGVIVLETMIWPDEVREAAFPFLDEDVDLRPQERAMAESLVASMAGDFDPDVYTDDYREALQQVIDAKVEGREVIETPQAEPTSGTVVDLMAALRASVEAAKASRGETGAAAPETARPRPVRRRLRRPPRHRARRRRPRKRPRRRRRHARRPRPRLRPRRRPRRQPTAASPASTGRAVASATGTTRGHASRRSPIPPAVGSASPTTAPTT